MKIIAVSDKEEAALRYALQWAPQTHNQDYYPAKDSIGAKLDAPSVVQSESAPITVEWVVNSLGELGVKVGDDFQWLYKGHSLRYEDPTHTDVGDKRESQPMLWRLVGKREFGECCHPVNYDDPTKWGTVDVNDGLDWKPIPPSKHPEAV